MQLCSYLYTWYRVSRMLGLPLSHTIQKSIIQESRAEIDRIWYKVVPDMMRTLTWVIILYTTYRWLYYNIISNRFVFVVIRLQAYGSVIILLRMELLLLDHNISSQLNVINYMYTYNKLNHGITLVIHVYIFFHSYLHYTIYSVLI